MQITVNHVEIDAHYKQTHEFIGSLRKPAQTSETRDSLQKKLIHPKFRKKKLSPKMGNLTPPDMVMFSIILNMPFGTFLKFRVIHKNANT
jgi:hypothetical protein